MTCGFSKSVDMPFDAAIEKVTTGLQKEGFGVLTTLAANATITKLLTEVTKQEELYDT